MAGSAQICPFLQEFQGTSDSMQNPFHQRDQLSLQLVLDLHVAPTSAMEHQKPKPFTKDSSKNMQKPEVLEPCRNSPWIPTKSPHDVQTPVPRPRDHRARPSRWDEPGFDPKKPRQRFWCPGPLQTREDRCEFDVNLILHIHSPGQTLPKR